MDSSSHWLLKPGIERGDVNTTGTTIFPAMSNIVLPVCDCHCWHAINTCIKKSKKVSLLQLKTHFRSNPPMEQCLTEGHLVCVDIYQV